ncbi:hypothetical protein GXP67_14460 [Rhodocytophaga rosea]|uniref:Uncharacterized protein n=1 Tax=Rhodocytophaga rosea TaxID=2704465 RepID=A0A6C0GIF4_9BACT|nr:hypothetical protein [Rhodocytophaga rosea]QHT67749.1 hypothetical protein GXP67_14460 [Rhodocytophaga rosea]
MILLFSYNGYSQTTKPTLIYQEEFTFSQKVYRIKVENVSDDYKYKITMNDSTFNLIELKPDVFKRRFIETIGKLEPSIKTKLISDTTLKIVVEDKADEYFLKIVTQVLTTIDKSPTSGYLLIEQPKVVTYDYFEYYGTIGWSKKKLLESIAKYSLEMYRLKDYLLEHDSYFGTNNKIDYINNYFKELKFTKVNRGLTELQKQRLLAAGFTNKELHIIFPDSLPNFNIDTLCISADTLYDFDSIIIKDSIMTKRDSAKAKPDTIKIKQRFSSRNLSYSQIPQKFEKPNKYLANVLENLQQVISKMTGRIQDNNEERILRRDSTDKKEKLELINRKISDIKTYVESFRADSVKYRKLLATDTLESRIKQQDLVKLKLQLATLQQKDTLDLWKAKDKKKKLTPEQRNY